MSHPYPAALRRALPPCVAFTLLAVAPAFAQQTAAPFAGTAPDAATSLDEISVSATGVPTPLARTGSSVTVLTAETLEAQQRRTVPDALQQVPGLNVVQTGGPGGQTSVFIRGANSNHTKVLIDGIDATDPSNGNGSFDFGQLLTEDFSRIEVLRGPQSGLYGSDAIGGVVSFTTKRGAGPTRITTRVEGGSFGTFNQSGRISGAQDGFDYSVSVQHLRAAATPVTPRNLIAAGLPIRPNYYDNETVSAKLGYQFTDTFRVNSVTRFINSRLLLTGDDYGTFPVTLGAFRGEADVQQVFSRNEAEWTPIAGFHNIFAINYSNLFNRQATNVYDPLNPIPTTGLGERTRYEYRGDYLLSPGNLLLFGAQRDEESLSTIDLNPFGSGSLKARNGNTAGYGEAQLTPFDRASFVANLRHDENDAFGPATTFRVAPSYVLPFSETRLKGSVGTGFKAPTLSQLSQSFPAFNFFANSNLKPEESLGYDAGIEQPFGDRVLAGVTYYRNDFTNLIAANATFTSNENVGKAESYGAEAFVSVRFTDTLSGRVDYTNTVTKNEITNQELLRRPRHKGSATALWTPLPGLTVSGTVIVLGHFVDGNRDFSVTRLKNPGFTIVNLAVNYDVNETVSVFGRVDNLFDRRYENPTGFLGPGLAVYGGVRVSTF
ncbi:TonB-dependent receptor plug domain-containing protein [Methylobacterium haplocladii]|uniref:TonB-dependent receptor n=1 Tax=Methylobacterium haplocladii TaxID=1176176 RepID=A0A512IPS6_9HYPH|nr:TonB-dependent receptor [Methylobacterium haplocladii]GEO99682.1 TonB-dependent receptor [Methylobacterium haplocladii]GJD83376.1 Vitamin B12 transporter BtuB [Methylobacterium haplocladii]GLS61439.1 TonB-dependent receptor [Methylobacterium haplocladii]